ncbi:hypothetical protein CN917_29115 [Bacillus thuringiensis]|nr:hypothetical protein CN917_29115 [Bacillus thuringiensis]
MFWYLDSDGVAPHRYQPKFLKYPLNENFLYLQVVFLRSQLIYNCREIKFSHWGGSKIIAWLAMHQKRCSKDIILQNTFLLFQH